MQSRLLTAAIAAASVFAGPAAAMVMLQSSDNIFCHGDSCFGIDRGVGSAAPITVGGLTVERGQLGNLGSSLVHVTLWTSDGARLVGDYGDFQLSALNGDQLTIRGPGVTFDSSAGGVMFRFDRVDASTGAAGGGGGGGGGFAGGGSVGSGSGGGGFNVADAVGGDGRGVATNNSGEVEINNNDDFVRPGPARLIPRGVPEPAAWALMLVGLGGLGGVLRRRRAIARAV
jgi:hypothetical protein